MDNIITTVGVIVGRFQVHSLHEGHKELIDFVRSKHDKVVIVLGLSPCKCTINNPLDFEARKQMILSEYPDVIVLYLKDQRSDKLWSKKLDELIEDVLGPNQTAILYGSRDSFISRYHGKFKTKHLEPSKIVRGTDIRKQLSSKTKASPDFRAGVIWAVYNQYPKCIPTVDVAITKQENGKTYVLLCRKENSENYKFIGGFVEPGETWEQAVRREVLEETNLEITTPNYIGSYVIDDWRYKYETDKITTTFFESKILYGQIKPQDDIVELRWFPLEEETIHNIEEEHHILFNELIKKLEG